MYKFVFAIGFALSLNTVSYAQEQCRRCNSAIEDYILIAQDTKLKADQKVDAAREAARLCEMYAGQDGDSCPDLSLFEKCLADADPSPACLGFPDFEAAFNADKQIHLYLTAALDSNISNERRRTAAFDAAEQCVAFNAMNTIEFATGRTPCPSIPDYDECASKGDLTLTCLGYAEWKARLSDDEFPTTN